MIPTSAPNLRRPRAASHGTGAQGLSRHILLRRESKKAGGPLSKERIRRRLSRHVGYLVASIISGITCYVNRLRYRLAPYLHKAALAQEHPPVGEIGYLLRRRHTRIGFALDNHCQCFTTPPAFPRGLYCVCHNRPPHSHPALTVLIAGNQRQQLLVETLPTGITVKIVVIHQAAHRQRCIICAPPQRVTR